MTVIVLTFTVLMNRSSWAVDIVCDVALSVAADATPRFACFRFKSSSTNPCSVRCIATQCLKCKKCKRSHRVQAVSHRTVTTVVYFNCAAVSIGPSALWLSSLASAASKHVLSWNTCFNTASSMLEVHSSGATSVLLDVRFGHTDASSQHKS